jgi:cytochrome c1
MNKTSVYLILLLVLINTGCSHPKSSAPDLMVYYGCPTCHTVSCVPGAIGKVGPPLDALRQRTYLAGVLPNNTSNLEQWIMHPQHFRPGTAMPEMNVTSSDAKEIARFLYAR